MDSELPSDQITIAEIQGKKYALVSLCTFHDINSIERSETIKKLYGLKDMYKTVSLYEIEDERKLVFMKLKYSIEST